MVVTSPGHSSAGASGHRVVENGWQGTAEIGDDESGYAREYVVVEGL